MGVSRRTGRLPWPVRGELDDDRARVYDRIVDSRGASGRAALSDSDGRLLGPFNAMLVSPALGDALQQLGAAIRYGSSLPDRVRELAILTVAVHRRSGFEWYAHAPSARDAGLTDAELAGLRERTGDGLCTADQLVHGAVISLLAQRDLDDQAFAELQELLGVTGVVELVTLVGYYDLLALSMRSFRVPLPDGSRPQV